MQHINETMSEEHGQLPILVNGLPMRGASPAQYTLQAAIASFSENERRKLSRLRDALGPTIGIIDSHFDDVALLFGALGFETRGIASEDLGETDLRLVAIGCPHRHTRLDRIDTCAFLERKGVLVSSDRAARLPGIVASLGHRRGRPQTRARLSTTGCDDDPTIAPVWLDPGHLPIDPATLGDAGETVMAVDRLSGEALAVLTRAGRGGILHSVPHWLQVPHPELLTSVERRPLRDVPRFRHVGNSYPDLMLGQFLGQRAMARLLVSGLTAAIKSDSVAKRPGHGQEK